MNGVRASASRQAAQLPQSVGNFKLVTTHKLEFADVQIAKWQSQKTGLTVVHADVESPIVSGYFTIATEIFNDDGLPHTLEHIIFMGSEKYPYKGVLDTLANRQYSFGTNAWTDTTNTTYTIATAGAEGFLRITPVYIDHILFPTMTEPAFTTEVYHINEKGEDSGVVFSEMQGRENGSGDLMELRLQRTLYTQKNALRSETGGLMSALRKLTNKQIRDYHASMYLPHNLTLIVVGRSLAPEALLSMLDKDVEPSLIQHGFDQGPVPKGWTRPFVESTTASNPPKLDAPKVEVVEFPERDESTGELMISWPTVSILDFEIDLALEVIGVYLTDSAVSPLYKEFVEIEEPACTDITFHGSTHPVSVVTAYISSVPVSNIDELATKFKAALKRIATVDGIDMERMQAILTRLKNQVLEALEAYPADTVMDWILTDSLFAKRDGSQMEESMKLVSLYRKLESYSAKEWAELLKKYFVDAHSVTVAGKPSASLAESNEAADKKRVEDTRKRLGPDGLAKKGEALKKAQQENDREIPKDMIASFPVPDASGIEWISVSSGRKGPQASKTTDSLQKYLDADSTDTDVPIQFDHIDSHFIEISLHLFSHDLPQPLLALLPVYLDSFFTLPVVRNGKEIAYEDVVRQLDAETLSYSIECGDPVRECILVRMKVEKSKYALAVAWLRDLLFASRFSTDRLKVSLAKAIQGLPAEKRNGQVVAFDTFRQLVSDETSTNLSTNLLIRLDSLPQLAERLESDPKGVVADLEKVRRGLTAPTAMRVSVKGDIMHLDKPVKIWQDNFRQFDKSNELLPVVMGKDRLSAVGKRPAKKLVLFEISSIESCFAYHVATAPDHPLHPDQPALMVARAVLNAMESYLWKYIRGAGLAYGASVSHDVESGLIWLRIFKSPDAEAAFAAAKQLMNDIVSGKIELDDLTVESAKSSLAYTTASRVATLNDAANASFANQVLFGVSKDFGREQLEKIKPVTKQDILESIKKYIVPIFDPATSIASVATGKAKADSLAKRFADQGFEVERRSFGEAEDGSDDESHSGSDSE